jgi:transposase
MKNLKYSIGTDVSMKDFACCISVINDQQEVKVKATHKFANSAAGFASFLDWVRHHRKEELPTVFVMEATGVYHEQLAWFLHHKNQQVNILLPNRAKRYLQADGNRSKNDTIDARGLAKIGAERNWTFGFLPVRCYIPCVIIRANIKALMKCTQLQQTSCMASSIASSETRTLLNS